jgi:hypothetical protein
MVEERGAYGILVWRPEGRRPLGRPRRRWEDNIKKGQEIQEDGADMLSRDVGKGLPFDAALYPRRAQISNFVFFTLQFWGAWSGRCPLGAPL